MLDMSSIEISKLASEYARGKVMYLILGIGLIFLSIMFCFAIYKMFYAYDYKICIFPIIFTVLCVCIGFNLMINDYVKFCQVTIKVIPTENLTIEQMKKSDKFIEKDGDYYYVKIVKTPALSYEELNYSNFNVKIDQIKSDFNEDIDFIYFKDKIINK